MQVINTSATEKIKKTYIASYEALILPGEKLNALCAARREHKDAIYNLFNLVPGA
jgi:hypothetical protein